MVAALILSQSLGILLVSAPAVSQSASAFNFGKKKEAAAQDGTAADDAKGSKGAQGSSTADDKGKDDAPKEKVKGMSKADIKEEEELTAEYEAYQKQLNDLLKSVKTPFGSNSGKVEVAPESALSPLSIGGASGRSDVQTMHQSLGQRLLQCKVYMPGRMMIGRPAEFTIKARSGYWAALAMADKDKGAKPIYGHNIRLGPDRKVVALGKIPASGVLTLKIFAPVAGDLVGGNLFFEAAIWPENHPESLELALPVSSETQTASTANSVGQNGQAVEGTVGVNPGGECGDS